jgi:hypothetical protein
MKYACGCCDKVYDEEAEAKACCDSWANLRSECCEASVEEGVEREHHSYVHVHVCDNCGEVTS